MTAASPACSPASSQSSSLCLPGCHTFLKQSDAYQTKLRLASAPGVWLLLGVVVVLVGMSVAIAGYVSAPPKSMGARGITHAERMKMVGPFVMGVGIFIVICAATLLYENRDLEIRRLETCDDLQSLRVGNSWEESQEQLSFNHQEEYTEEEEASWATPPHIPPLSSQTSLLPLALLHSQRHSGPSPPPTEVGGTHTEEVDRKQENQGKSIVLTRVLHHQEPTSQPPSPCLSISSFSGSCKLRENNKRTGSSETL
ncbi:transmembrane protein 200B [Oryzias latipes]|uniref:transmembrane protein 200B n=1 Tax=Oryzias latipes TaxID=8090 RepID=UPI0002A4BA0C|nr:transmembrane protein 200B [Oryzias latipes]XP_020565848.1 transmembrane protein 200B [Oryzias latipes]